ncbi:MAG: conjugative transfer signal peptidase TraF [Nitrospira sp.]|nr:conjugative transfer signal peptidase TraF [Nitrospira sp.]MBX3350705.1 conjugative transfer signal peptidase TraF [Nitrospira sp.]
MTSCRSRVRHPLVIVGLCLAVGLVLVHQFGLRLNTTRSIPLGLYKMSHDPIEKGVYVLWCPPERPEFDLAKERGYIGVGFCPGGYGNMMKRVLAEDHDLVSVSDDGVRVNEQLLPLSAPIDEDAVGRPLPRYRLAPYVLGDAEFLLMSESNARSFDARYFGPIDRRHIQGVIHPLWTW